MNRARDDKRESRGVVEAARLPPTLAVKRHLLAKKEILGGQVRMRAQAEREQLQEITDQTGDGASITFSQTPIIRGCAFAMRVTQPAEE